MKHLFYNLLWLLVLGSPFRVATAQTPAVAPDRSAIESVVRDYILQHPEVIAQAANLYQQRQQLAQRAKSQEEISKHLLDLQHDPSSPFSGPAAGLTVIEFFDYRCGFCRRGEPALQKLLAEHPGIRVVFKEFPILGPESTLAAKASLAANQQGDYLAFHRALMTLSGAISMEAIERLATTQGLNVTRLRRDMESPEVLASLARNKKLAMQVGVTATPSFIVGSDLVSGALDSATFDKVVSQAEPSAPRSINQPAGFTK